MELNKTSRYGIFLFFAMICTLMLLYAMVAFPVFKEQVFGNRGTISPGGETGILIAFLFVAAFDIVTMLWILSRLRKRNGSSRPETGLAVLGTLCLILLFVDKVLADEISHEYSPALEFSGEFVMLYLSLVVQLIFNLLRPAAS